MSLSFSRNLWAMASRSLLTAASRSSPNTEAVGARIGVVAPVAAASEGFLGSSSSSSGPFFFLMTRPPVVMPPSRRWMFSPLMPIILTPSQSRKSQVRQCLSFLQLIFGPRWPMDQLYKNPNIT